MNHSSKPILRFAPSPTGFLHIGGARTALFNWLFARHSGGKFLLRIEDTDRARSTPEAIAAILSGLKWLKLDWDGEPVFQSARAGRQREIAEELLSKGLAYRCYATPEELEAMRSAQRLAGQPVRYDGRWRDRSAAETPKDVPFAIRIKAPQAGETVVHDVVQGDVRFENSQLDDMILVRSDGTPTYMLAVVVDDYDMGITHVVRGTDHLNNAARQLQIIQAMGWPVPIYAHVPLIHGEDGAKLSKRHGALAVEAYRDMGYLPEAMCNYLLRLGWSHGDDEIIPREKAIAWFTLENIGRSPARFDTKKLDSMNANYMRDMSDETLAEQTLAFLKHVMPETRLTVEARSRLVAAMPSLKPRAKTLVELVDNARFLFHYGSIEPDKAGLAILTTEARSRLKRLLLVLERSDWNATALEERIRGFAETEGLKLGEIAQPLRVALTGRTTSPPVFEMLAILGREESVSRIQAHAI